MELAKTELFYGHRLRHNRQPKAARQHLRDALQIFQQYDAAHFVQLVSAATNRKIAAQLFISHRAVEHHLRNIFARLEVRSRVELTRLADTKTSAHPDRWNRHTNRGGPPLRAINLCP
jgi:FixJ family two-component response regulator